VLARRWDAATNSAAVGSTAVRAVGAGGLEGGGGRRKKKLASIGRLAPSREPDSRPALVASLWACLPVRLSPACPPSCQPASPLFFLQSASNTASLSTPRRPAIGTALMGRDRGGPSCHALVRAMGRWPLVTRGCHSLPAAWKPLRRSGTHWIRPMQHGASALDACC
jgi:hypothetical protein